MATSIKDALLETDRMAFEHGHPQDPMVCSFSEDGRFLLDEHGRVLVVFSEEESRDLRAAADETGEREYQIGGIHFCGLSCRNWNVDGDHCSKCLCGCIEGE
jgi:hypothetical protein